MTADARLRRGSPGLLMLAALLVTACSVVAPSRPSVTPSLAVASPSPATPAPTAVATPILPTATPETDPAWVADLAGQLQCTGPVSDTGQEVPDQPGPFEPAPSPDKALDVLRLTYTSLPKGGFLPTEVVGDWARYEFRVGGRTKVVAVATDRFEGITEDVGWEVVGLRACDLSEYAAAEPPPAGATVWLDRTGARVRTDIVISMPGPEHCGWQSTVFLYMNREDQFFRDPKGVLADESMGRFKADTKLPKDATDTGYHTKRWRIFTVPAGDAVYVKTASGTVERWPRARVGVGCA